MPRPAARLTAVVAVVAAAGLASLAVSLSSSSAALLADAPADACPPDLPRFRLAEVRKHGPESEKPWVVYGDRVYDITDWVPAHPGGQVILRAAGGSIDAYWDIFTIHKNQYVYDILAQYLIGYVHHADLVDGRPAQESIEDPFADDPRRHPDLITMTARPCNAETPGEVLDAHFLTPNDLFYVRNHMWVPKVDPAAADAHVLTVELLDGSVKQYTLHDLKTSFPSRSVTAVLQCSGNRRRHMTQGSRRPTNGLQWSAGAISNASWQGVLLSDVLADAGFDVASGLGGTSQAKHVHFAGLEAYGASIPIKKAVDPQGDVLLAYSMNGVPLTPDHGFPLRAIVPGHVAARSVKWLSQIVLSEEESTSQWQRRDYKCFGPNETNVDWDAAPAIQELPVQSAITAVKLGGWVDRPADAQPSAGLEPPSPEPARELSLGGYAFSGAGRAIVRVDVSLDDGRSWAQARLLPDCDADHGEPDACHGHASWSWRRWRFRGTVPRAAFREPELSSHYPADAKPEGTSRDSTRSDEPDQGAAGRRCTTVTVKATDETYGAQPETHAATWNLRGNLATAWHRIQVCTDCVPSAVVPPDARPNIT